MKNKIMIAVALMLTLSVTSCHKDSDVVLNYAVNDDAAYNEAYESFGGKFKVFWKSMNTMYSLWDYEKECGLDWDVYYNEMLPKFVELDSMTTVTDKQLEEVMREMAAPLHDGHMSIEFQNHKTGNFVRVHPSDVRNESRPDYAVSKGFAPDLTAYDTNRELVEWMESNTTMESQLRYMLQTPGIGYRWALAKYDELSQKANPTEKDATTKSGLYGFMTDVEQLLKNGKVNTDMIEKFNELVIKYSYLNIPYLEPISLVFDEAGICVKYALFNDNIAYLYLSSFGLNPYMSDDLYKKSFGDSQHAIELAKSVKRVYDQWFGAIQDLHKNKKLKGVIIDLRSNPGGYLNDAKYVLGSLVSNEELQYGYARFKRGPGRYDYSPYTPVFTPTMSAEHEIVDDVPITILINCRSISMSETTALVSQRLPNARRIGRRSWGGFCILTDASDFASNYSGHIGVARKTPVYVYLPMVGIFDLNKKCLEGYGVEPDIEVDFDMNEYQNTGFDTQLDRALKYIRTGN